MEGARYVEDDMQHDCPLCGAKSPYVLYDGDKMCEHCGHVPGAGGDVDEQSEYEQWREHRRANYSGWTGPERVKFPGGFKSAYQFGEDFLSE